VLGRITGRGYANTSTLGAEQSDSPRHTAKIYHNKGSNMNRRPHRKGRSGSPLKCSSPPNPRVVLQVIEVRVTSSTTQSNTPGSLTGPYVTVQSPMSQNLIGERGLQRGHAREPCVLSGSLPKYSPEKVTTSPPRVEVLIGETQKSSMGLQRVNLVTGPVHLTR
jgi:hypothetical protein